MDANVPGLVEGDLYTREQTLGGYGSRPHDRYISPGGGVKNDAGKARFDLLVPEFIKAMAERLAWGAKEYGDNNWKGLEKSRVMRAMMHHQNEVQMGNMDDDEAPYGSHCAAIAINAMFYQWICDNETKKATTVSGG